MNQPKLIYNLVVQDTGEERTRRLLVDKGKKHLHSFTNLKFSSLFFKAKSGISASSIDSHGVGPWAHGTGTKASGHVRLPANFKWEISSE